MFDVFLIFFVGTDILYNIVNKMLIVNIVSS